VRAIFIGFGAVVASAMPYILTNLIGITETRVAGSIPISVRLSFYLGAAAFFGAAAVEVGHRMAAGQCGLGAGGTEEPGAAETVGNFDRS